MKKTLLLMFAFVLAAVNMVAQTTVTFDATADKTANSAQTNNETLTKGGVTVVISQGVMGNGTDYRCYKNQTLTVSSTAGNVQKVVLTCTANGETKYGPGCFDAQEGYTFEADGPTGTWTGDAASVEFKASANQVRMTKIEVTVSGEGGGTTDPDPGTDPDTKVTLFSESFGANLGDFTTDDVTMDEPLTYVWSYGGANYGAKASAFVNKTNYAAESWLISPVIDLTKATECELAFEQAANFFKSEDNFKAACSVKVKAEGGEWTSLAFDAYPNGTSWNFTASAADLKAYDGKKVQLAFVYTSTETMAGTWEVKNIVVKGLTDEAPIVINAPTFNPAAGTYKDKVTVTLTADEGLSIYYTLDGTKPGKESTLYTAPFDLTETTTVTAVAIDAEGNESENVAAKYTIKQSPVAPENGVVFDFNANKWGLEISTQENTVPISGPITEGEVSITFTDGSTPTRMWNDFNEGTQIRMYKDGGSASFLCTENYTITKIEFNASKFDMTADCGTLDGKVWTGAGNNVTFTANATTNINYILVTLTKASGIEGVEADGCTETIIYSLDGRRLQKAAKGVNIVNGKKVLVK